MTDVLRTSSPHLCRDIREWNVIWIWVLCRNQHQSALRPKSGLRRAVDRAQVCLSWFGRVIHHNSDMILAIRRARYSPLLHWDILAVKEILVSNIFIRRCQEAHMWVRGETLKELKSDENTINCRGFFINEEKVLFWNKHLSLSCKVHFNHKQIGSWIPVGTKKQKQVWLELKCKQKPVSHNLPVLQLFCCSLCSNKAQIILNRTRGERGVWSTCSKSEWGRVDTWVHTCVTVAEQERC